MNFLDKDGKPELKISFCAFMDVLGFSEEIKTSFANKTHQELFQRFQKAISREFKNITPDHDDSLFQLKAFTDNIVLGYPLFTEDAETEFGHMISALKQYQMGMALDGFFIRGGVAGGFLYMDENTVYGDCLLEAYEIESKIARDPRIVLSKDVLELVQSHITFYSEPQFSPQNREVLIDSDGQAFINYLDELIITDEEVFVLWKQLAIHKDNIEKALARHYGVPVVWSKYYWLANYHNYFCSTVSNLKGYSSAYLVQDSLFRREPQTIVPMRA